MKLLTAIKKAKEMTEKSNGAIECFVKRNAHLNKRWVDVPWIFIDETIIQIDGKFQLEDLFAKDWGIEKESVE